MSTDDSRGVEDPEILVDVHLLSRVRTLNILSKSHGGRREKEERVESDEGYFLFYVSLL